MFVGQAGDTAEKGTADTKGELLERSYLSAHRVGGRRYPHLESSSFLLLGQSSLV